MRRTVLLVLVASGLLLIASSPRPSPYPTHEGQTAAAEHHATANPISTHGDQPGSKPAPTNIYNNTYSYYYPLPVSESPPVRFQIFTTLVLLCFTAGLWWTSVRQWRAIKDSAEYARLALHVNRPYLIVKSIRPNLARFIEQPISSAEVILQNAGSSPAELLEIIATSWKFDCMADASEPKWDGLTLDAPRPIDTPIVGVDESTQPIAINIRWVNKNDIELVNVGAKRVGLYGIIRYRGGPKEPYYTRFFWWFSPMIRDGELQRAWNPDLNERV
jgi:hypothetical protein